MVTPEREKQLVDLLKNLGFSAPSHLDYYDQALTHSSYTYENKLSPLENYERLEFLGDAILKLATSDYLYHRFPDYREGDLTKIRAVVVSDISLSHLARSIQLGKYMIMGISESKSGGVDKASNLACAFEALLGALYLDGKLEEILKFLSNILQEQVTKIDLSKTKENYKAVLQELTQAEGNGLPVYRLIGEEGPSHDKTFSIEVLINHEVVGYGSGKTKKEAQQNAAKMALNVLNEFNE